MFVLEQYSKQKAYLDKKESRLENEAFEMEVSTEIINSANMDMRKREQLEAELLQLIEQYLEKVTPDYCDDDGIAACSYFLLKDVFYSDSLLNYLQASASALAAFARVEVQAPLKKHMADYEFHALCDMLKRMIEFCNRVERNDKILAQFDQLTWEIMNTSHISTTSIIIDINKYENLIKRLNA